MLQYRSLVHYVSSCVHLEVRRPVVRENHFAQDLFQDLFPAVYHIILELPRPAERCCAELIHSGQQVGNPTAAAEAEAGAGDESHLCVVK